MRKSAFGRTNLFLQTTDAIFREICCSASSSTRQADTSIFHSHAGNGAQTCPEGTVCWHCCHAFDTTKGMRLPRIYDSTDNLYHVYGWFCSANCAKAYILEHSTFDRGYQMNIFVRMLREVYKITESVVESPPRISLQMFGGPFDIERFRTHTINKHHLVTPPFVSYSMLVEERQNGPSRCSEGASASAPSSSGAASAIAGTTRGSVRGLRRPVQRAQLLDDSDNLAAEPMPVMYENFLQQKQSSDRAGTPDDATDEKATLSRGSSTNKRARVVPAAPSGARSGLAKFAKD